VEAGRENCLILNTGDNFLGRGKEEEKKAELIMTAYSLMRVDLIGLGEKEFVFGDSFLRHLAACYSGNFLCSNLAVPDQTQNFFLPYLVIKKDDKRILISSILDPSYKDYLHQDTLTITDPVASLKRLQKEINHDLFIVIGHGERKNILAWIDQVDGIDLMIQGHQPGISRQLEKYNNTFIVSNNIRGSQYIACLDISWSPAGRVIISQPKAIRANARQTKEDPGIANLINNYEKWRRDFLQQQTCSPPPAPGTEQKSGIFYLGIQVCKRCHQQQFRSWRQTPHSRAIITLLRKQKESDPACLPCHVTGMNRKDAGGGFRSITETPRLTNVQCEACHGPASRHPQNPKAAVFKPVTRQTCKQCHTPDADPEFNFEQDRLEVDHRAHHQPKGE
jgi:hypothetical protein